MLIRRQRRKQFFIIGFSILLLLFGFLPFLIETASAAGTITVIKPSDGQTLYRGDSFTIQWYSYNVVGTVKIELYKSGSFYSTITSSTPNNDLNNYYHWTIPTNLPTGSSYKIKISNQSGAVYEYSDYFFIDSRFIEVTYPDADSTWYQGEIYTINWNSDDAGYYLKIELYRGGSYYSTISSNAYNKGYYAWEVPSTITSSSSYRIKITSNTYSGTYDYSEYFSIESYTITVTSPSEEEVVYQGESYPITWSSDVAGNVRIELYKDDSYYKTITSSTHKQGTYYWSVSQSLPVDSSYKIKITSLFYSNVYDYSDYFSIDERFIILTSPQTSDVWFMDEELTIEWDSKNAGDYVKIELYDGTSFFSTITAKTSNDGSYSWMIPSGLSDKSNYKIKITALVDSIVSDTSSYFFINERTISIFYPSGGEIWYIGEQCNIGWNSENIGKNVKIDLFEDGSYHSTITSNTSNDGSYYWTVPSTLNNSADYSIKITSTSYENVFEFSNGYISVEKPLIQSWLGTLILILSLIVVGALILTLFKKGKIKLPKLKTSLSQQKTTQHPREKIHDVKEEKISQEEYDRIWEESY